MRNRYIPIVLLACFIGGPLFAQDSTLNRSVVVERQFDPTLEEAIKINTTPIQMETQLPSSSVEYSTYSHILAPDYNVSSLLYQPQRFSISKVYPGLLRVGGGHVNTLFDFVYRLDDGRKSILNVNAHHRATWGRYANSVSSLGFDFEHPFSNCVLYFGVNGHNKFYTRYGRYYDGDQGLLIDSYDQLQPEDKQTIWQLNTLVGVRSNPKSDIQYLIQTGYTLYNLPNYISEHQIRTTASLDWHSDAHHVGLNAYVQNSLLQTLCEDITEDMYRPRHAFRIEPFYAYKGKRVQLHAGINLDINLGRGQQFSSIENLSFAPSPKVEFEAQIAPQWLTIYGEATGRFGIGTVESFMNAQPYRQPLLGVTSQHLCGYTPIDAILGFHMRPQRNLLIDIHAGYAYQKDQLSCLATVSEITTSDGLPIHPGTFSYLYSNYGCFKIGGAMSYHYQDIIDIHLWGDYYAWASYGHEEAKDGYQHLVVDSASVFDRPAWELGLRIDGRIDEHWSLFSKNYFAGSRIALTTDGEKILKPTIDLSLGCKYETRVGKRAMKRAMPNLVVEFSLDNYLHRRNDIYYGYQSNGIQGTLALTWRF